MVVNQEMPKENVKFVSYTGEYPNLCSGILTLNIDGIDYTFGYSHNNKNQKTDFLPFWSSGGWCGFDENWNEGVACDYWNIYTDELPEQFKQYADEIDIVFNANVEYGCCGGCI